MTPEQIEQVRQIYREEFQKNYLSGAPKLAPHTHNGIDNLLIPPGSIEGGVVTKIDAGTNITITPTSGTGEVTISSTGGGGGSPGGNDTDIQFNDGGNFGGNDHFTFNKVTGVMSIYTTQLNKYGIYTQSFPDNTTGYYNLKVKGGNADQATPYTHGGTVYIGGGNGNFAGSVSIYGGYAANIYAYGGGIRLQAGGAYTGSLSGIIHAQSGGTTMDIVDNNGIKFNLGSHATYAPRFIAYGSHVSSPYSSSEGWITIYGANAAQYPFPMYGHIFLHAGNSNAVGANVVVDGYGSGAHHGGNLDIGNITGGKSTNAAWSLILRDTKVPTGATTGGGILFSYGGALTFMGSGGTVTTVAPA